LVGSSTIRGSAAVQRLHAACLDHLRTRIAQPLEAPKDWRRASALVCSCRHCTELGRFLADSERRIWTFKAAEAESGHVEGTVTRVHCDIDLTTDSAADPTPWPAPRTRRATTDGPSSASRIWKT
jgi:hypothetical protein